MKVVPLRPDLNCADLVKALRTIADDIEGDKMAFDPDFAVLVIGRESQRRDADGFRISYDWQTHALGERASFFAARGLLSSALGSFDGSNR